MTAIVLHGDLASFGGPYQWDVQSPNEAVRALCSQISGFRKRLSSGSFRVILRAAGRDRGLDRDTLARPLQCDHEIHIVPVVAGSGKGGTGKIILGSIILMSAIAVGGPWGGAAAVGAEAGMAATAVTVAGFGITFSQLAGFGAMMVLSGVSQALAPSPSSPSAGANADPRPSFIFNGPANVSEQGVAIPLVYGRFVCGSVTISSDLKSGDI